MNRDFSYLVHVEALIGGNVLRRRAAARAEGDGTEYPAAGHKQMCD
jgi:hypothetical protein